MKIQSINPSTGKPHKEFELLSPESLAIKLNTADEAFQSWKTSSFSNRRLLLEKIAQILRAKKEVLAEIMALEMGKRVSEGTAEIEKCAWVCEYYAENAENILKQEIKETDAQKSFVIFEPLGVILAVMPWNFPFWQVFRCAAPAIMAGNVVVLKHASSVPESAQAIEEIFIEAGARSGLFQTLLISSAQIPKIIEDQRIRMISLTGSEEAGSSVASIAGKHIKKTVMELGGSDPFIVLEDADVAKAAESAAHSRMIVSGQSCIAAKRFLINQKIAPLFLKLFIEHLSRKKIGDPMNPSTDVGPLSSARAVDSIHDQVQRSVAQGAKVALGGQKMERQGFYYPPTVLTNLTEDSPVMKEETFGPIAAVMIVKNDQEALEIANNSHYGLGASVWTKNDERADFFIYGLQAGGVFVNSMVKSDPRMPFGGSKFSGYGRELSDYGLKEFTNIKSVWKD
jgi:succinate-semialdehyde dehydrogenase/glutarate-semialdehyde dehydrogenase